LLKKYNGKRHQKEPKLCEVTQASISYGTHTTTKKLFIQTIVPTTKTVFFFSRLISHMTERTCYTVSFLMFLDFFSLSMINHNRCLLIARYFAASADLRLIFQHLGEFLLPYPVIEPQPLDSEAHALPMRQYPALTITCSRPGIRGLSFPHTRY
jgi:hypothetical protein